MSSSTPTPTPVILPEDIKFYLSGGYFNADPPLSLGGEISSFQLISGSLNGLFDRVDTSEAELGDTEYRCIYLRNTSQTRKLLATRIWIETGTASADTAIGISLGSSGINGIEPTIPDEGVAPPMNFFEVPLSEPEEPNIGDLYPGDHIALWVRWYVNTGTTSIADDFAVLRIDGDREPESVSQPIPDPTDPPPSTEGCPHGSKWSPTEMRCVDDSTVIICPNGYTYNSTTQRCVPPTTPPPSLGNWTFAAAGDYSCTSAGAATATLQGSKLNKTAGADVGLVLALGDFSYVDGDQSCWFDDMSSGLGSTIYPENVAPILGNHDDSEDGASSDRTDVIAEFSLIPTSGYYAFTRKNIRFIMMDTQSSYGTTSAQYAFVKAELEAATANPAIKWKVVCYHKPSFTSATDYGPLTDLRSAYHPLFDTHKVDLIFNGHNHNYGRSKPVRYNAASPGTPIIASDQTGGNYINIDGRVFITSGAAGRSSHPEFTGTIENFMGFRHEPSPYGSSFVTLQDSGNQLRVQFITNANQILDDFTLSKPGATPPPGGGGGVPVCPQGFNWDSTLERCVISPTQCPTNYRWEPAQNKCVAMTGTPPPPPGPVDPMVGVEWYYDSTVTQNTPQTISAGSYDSVEGILLASSYADVSSMVIGSDGWLTMPGAGVGATAGSENSRLGVDYWKKSNFNSDERVGRNTAFYFKFIYNDNISIGIMDGCEYPTGILSPARIFGGFSISLFGPNPSPDNFFSDATGSRVNYWYNPTTGLFGQSTQTSSLFPGSRSFEVGKTYEVFGTYRTNKITSSVILNVWVNFGDEGGWIKTLTDLIYSQSTWAPLSTPTGFVDSEEIASGPPTHDELRRRRLVIRNNNSGVAAPRPSLKVRDIKIGTLPYVGDINNPPPGGGGGGGGGGTGGVLDSNGIRWFMATGQQGVIGQTRNESSDDRWSGNVADVSTHGYELTMYLTVGSIASGGHFACKMWGPNHSGDCGYDEGGDCCCWYDLGVRSNGDVQQEIERPHPSNDSFNKGKVLQNIGRGLGGQTTGLKWLIYPLQAGGSADQGGIKIKMWVDTSGLLNGKPQNNWRLAMDLVDTGDILGDYPNPDFEHDLEVRNSDSSGQSTYAGGLHWRKIIAGNTDQSGTGTGTTPPTQPPPTTTPPPVTGALLWDSNMHGVWNSNPRTVTSTYGSQAPNGKGYYMAASGDPRLIIDGAGIGKLEADPGHGRVYILATNFNSRLEADFRFDSSNIDNTTWRLRSRHNESGDCDNRFGGFGCTWERGRVEFQTESCHNNHENTIGANLSTPLQNNVWYRGAYSCWNNTTNTTVNFKLELDRKDGQGFQTVLTGAHTSPQDYYMDQASFMSQSYIWLRINNDSGTGSVSYRNVILTDLGTGGATQPPPTTPPPTTGTAFKIISWGDNDTTQDAEDVLNMIMTEQNVAAYLFAGDGPYSNSATEWINMMSSYFNTTTLKSRLMLAQGNHEHPESTSQQAEDQIEAWMPELRNADDNLDWLVAKRFGNVYVIVMNSQDLSGINTVGGDQYNWVQARLNDAVALRTAGTVDWIIVMVHKYWFSISTTSPDAYDTRYVYQTMLNNAQVDLILSGHAHNYQLWKPINTRTQGDNTDQGTQAVGTLSGSNWNFALNHGQMHITNGNGGHEINSFGSNPIPSTILYSNDDEYGYTVLEVNGKTMNVIMKSKGGNVRYTVTLVR